MSPSLDPSSVWDAWSAARRDRPEVEPSEFARTYGVDADEVLAVLASLQAIESDSEPSSLVDLFVATSGEATRFAGFRIERLLGQGTSGVVFLARDERPAAAHPDLRVALKVLNPLLSASPERRASILREARIARSLDHENVVRLLASGVERGYAWIATEWVDGETLAASITQRSSAREREQRAYEVGIQLARALAHAHERGVVHRDLKPANVLWSREGVLKVLDFGLARADGTAFTMSSTGEAVGTPLYMAPEQARGEADLGPATDVYAVGLILYEVASGRRLAAERGVVALLAKIAAGKWRLPRAWMQELPEGLAGIVSRCLEPHPADRYGSCRALERDLERARVGETPALGRLPRPTLWLRRARRHPSRVAAAIAVVGLLAWGSWYPWWTWPMPVTFDVWVDGKVLWVDGVEVGGTPQTVALRPGLHTYELRFPDGGIAFHGNVRVENREPRHVFDVFEPTAGPQARASWSIGPGPGATWVQVATPLHSFVLEVDKVRHEATFQETFCLPFGKHVLAVEAPGRLREEIEVDLRDQRLCFWSVAPAPIGSEWRETIVYGPFDWIVREGVVESRGMRTYFEDDPVDWYGKDLYVTRSYWGPEGADAASVLFTVDLPIVAGEIDLEMCMNSWGNQDGAWISVEMGPGPDSLIEVFRKRKDPVTPITERPSRPPDKVTNAYYERPVEATLTALSKAMSGRRELFIRLSAGGASVGGSCSYAQVLRGHAYPDVTGDGELVWAPALILRVRPYAEASTNSGRPR